jgi:hypothetical protein
MKETIPKALREQVWIEKVGKFFETKCLTRWCKNIITVFDFQCGHNIPESKGGTLDISNLFPICSRCNLSMGDRYTYDEWVKLSEPPSKWKVIKEFIKNTIWKTRPSVITENGIKSTPKHMNQKDKHFKFRGILLDTHTLPKKKHTERGIKRSKKT